MTLRLWEVNYSKSRATIDSDIVKEAVTVERLEEDMELELSELFPKHSELGRQAVRLLMHLEESGPQKQSELVEQLDMERYTLSRLLGRLNSTNTLPASVKERTLSYLLEDGSQHLRCRPRTKRRRSSSPKPS